MNIPIVLSTVGNLVLMLAGILLIPLGVAFIMKTIQQYGHLFIPSS